MHTFYLAAVLTTAIACCTVSATSCCRSYRSFRMWPQPPHKWRWEQGSLIISPQCFVNFTGCLSANTLWLSTSVSIGWRHRIWMTTVYWYSLFPVDDTWDWWTSRSWSFGEYELLLAPEILLSPVLSSGVHYLQICESRHWLWWHLPDTWKLACFVAWVNASEDCLLLAHLHIV